jgi:hypothetical protein
MNLMHDVLDQQIIDIEQQKAGKVDGIALEIRDDGPPRVAYLDVGMDVLARRFSARLERLVQRIHRRAQGHRRKPFQVAWDKVRNVAISVSVDVDDKDYSNFHVEQWLRDHIITKIPGNAHHKHQEKND